MRHAAGVATPYAGVTTVPPVNDVRDPAFMNPEKIVWDWPEVGSRIIEEFR